MRDNELYALLMDIIRVGLQSAGAPYNGAEVLQSYQPTQQGVPSTPAVFLHKLPDHRYGFLKRDDRYDEYDQEFVHTEMQYVETTFQVTVLVRQDPNNVAAMTANDLAERVAGILQSTNTLERLRPADVGMQRITAIRNPYFQDDRDQNEAASNFDFTLSHKKVILSTTPVINSIEINVDRV